MGDFLLTKGNELTSTIETILLIFEEINFLTRRPPLHWNEMNKKQYFAWQVSKILPVALSVRMQRNIHQLRSIENSDAKPQTARRSVAVCASLNHIFQRAVMNMPKTKVSPSAAK